MSLSFSERAIIVSSSCSMIFLAGLGLVAYIANSNKHLDLNQAISEVRAEESRSIVPVTHVPLPSEVRGIYMTARTAGSPRSDELIDYIMRSGLNAAVIDLKMDNGAIAFVPQDVSLFPYLTDEPIIDDLDGLLERLGEKRIYRVARLPVMRDGAFAEVHPEIALKKKDGEFWRDSIGSVWLDAAASEPADYAIALAREAYARGFDEVQFDYVRFPSDGATKVIVYPIYNSETQTKTEVMQTFFKKVGETTRADGIPVSFDVFGMTFWSADDYNIGQRLADVYPYADFVSPMVYPSHFPRGFEGYLNPAEYPYEIVKKSLDKGAEQLAEQGIMETESRAKFRPWLQDFDIGAVYGADKIEAQIKAARDAGASGWILWNARNVYEPADYGRSD